jgi:hypothetical protein
MAKPADDSKVVGTLARTDELVVIGKESNGYLNVQGANVTGWVKAVLLVRP